MRRLHPDASFEEESQILPIGQAIVLLAHYPNILNILHGDYEQLPVYIGRGGSMSRLETPLVMTRWQPVRESVAAQSAGDSSRSLHGCACLCAGEYKHANMEIC